jgi:soluble lytic murein transglycosylase
MSIPWLWRKWSRIVGVLGALLLISFVSFGFSSRLRVLYDTAMTRVTTLEGGVSELEQQMVSIKSAMNVDSIRQHNIQKITSIFNDRNKTLTAKEKYEIANEVYIASQKYTSLSVELICAMITQESGPAWKTNRVSPAGALGLMQIMPVTGMFMASYEGIAWTSAEDVLLNPIYNIRIGTRYMSALIDMYGLEGGLASYNGGETRARMWLAEGKKDGILYQETQAYVPSVLQLTDIYKNML